MLLNLCKAQLIHECFNCIMCFVNYCSFGVNPPGRICILKVWVDLVVQKYLICHKISKVVIESRATTEIEQLAMELCLYYWKSRL